MPDTLSGYSMDGVTTNANGTAVDVRNFTAIAVYASAVGGTSVDVALQATADPRGESGWVAAAFRVVSGAYATTAVSVTPAAPKSLYLDPADNIQFLRAVTTNQSGPTAVTVRVFGEQ